MNLSASQIKKHSQCPKAYEFRYETDIDPTKEQKEYLHLGSRVHESIEEVLESGHPGLDDVRLLKTAIQKEFRGKQQYEIPKKLYGQGMDCCEVAAKYLSKNQPAIEEIEARSEYRINGSIDQGVTAIMDLVTDTEVWDWKTGRIRDETPHEEKIQGAVYMAGFFDLMESPPEKVKFIYLKEEKVRTLDPNDENWEYMLAHAKKLMRSKESGRFPAKPGDHCYWCDHEFYCDSSPVGLGEVSIHEW